MPPADTGPKYFQSGVGVCWGDQGRPPTAQRRAVASDVPTATLLRADEVIEKRSLLWVISGHDGVSS